MRGELRLLVRTILLGGALLAAGAPEPVRAHSDAGPREARAAGGAEPGGLGLSRLRAVRGAAPRAELFAAKSWYVPPPPPPKPAAPPAPAAPALPFGFLGKMSDGERLTVFLVRGDRLYSVSAGDVIDGTYRVESIRAGLMTMTYLPLNISQTLAVGNNQQ